MPLLEELRPRPSRDGWLRRPRRLRLLPGRRGRRRAGGARPDRPEARGRAGPLPFPRQPGGEKLCLADYFQPIGGRPDLVAFQAVTRRRARSRRCTSSWSARASTAAASTSAAWHRPRPRRWPTCVNRRIRPISASAHDRGRRYSWGYPACPDLGAAATRSARSSARRGSGSASPRATSSTPSTAPWRWSSTTPRRATSPSTRASAAMPSRRQTKRRWRPRTPPPLTILRY